MKVVRLIACCIAMTSASSVAHSQASLAAENIVNSIAVTVKQPDGSDVDEVYTLVRDARVQEQWYYFPNQPRLTEVSVNGQRAPEMSFIRYTIPQNDGQIESGGLLTFSVSLSAPAAAIAPLKAKLSAELAKRGQSASPDAIRLAPIPINSATAAIYSPKTGQLVTETEANSVIVPTDGNGKIVFAMMLSQAGTDIYDALINGNAGIPVWVKYNFNGMTPPAGFKVTANWDQAYSHYSKDSKFRARASYFGWFSGSYSEDSTYIREELEKSSAIKIEAIQGGDFDAAKLDSYLQPIVKRLNDQILEDMKPPKTLDPAAATTPGTDGWLGGVGYSVAVKDAKYRKTGVETWDFSYSSIIERAGAANGAIGLARFPKAVRDAVVINIDAGNWDRAYFPMPNVPERVDSATLALTLKGGDIQVARRQFRWSAKDGWVNAAGNTPLNGAWLSLLSQPNLDKATLRWVADYSFSVGSYAATATATTPVSGETLGLSSPIDLIRVIRVSADRAFDSDPKLLAIDVSLSDGLRKATRHFELEGTSAAKTVTGPLFWPLPEQREGVATKVSAVARYTYADAACSVVIEPEAFSERFPANVIMLASLRREECRE